MSELPTQEPPVGALEALQECIRALDNAAVELAGQERCYCRACTRTWGEGHRERHDPDCPAMQAQAAVERGRSALAGLREAGERRTALGVGP